MIAEIYITYVVSMTDISDMLFEICLPLPPQPPKKLISHLTSEQSRSLKGHLGWDTSWPGLWEVSVFQLNTLKGFKSICKDLLESKLQQGIF